MSGDVRGELRVRLVKGRCGTCDWPTDRLPCPYCTVRARADRLLASADALDADQ